MAEGDLIWTPDSARVKSANLTRYLDWLAAERGKKFDDYHQLWKWSVDELEQFWASLWDFFEVRASTRYDAVLPNASMPGTTWFAGAELNYAERALARSDGETAVIFEREDGLTRQLSYAELRIQVGAARAGLRRLGVQKGDRVAALLPNGIEALVAFLATASLGAIWSSCSPEFGARAIADRFSQIEPKVLLAVDGYIYSGKRFDIRGTVDSLRGELPGLSATVLVPYLDDKAQLANAVAWSDLLAEEADVQFDPVPFEHPLWILYSSGTTGLPKPIVQSQGGILLEHLKALALHSDLHAGDRFFWFTTTGWMMWNFLVSGLLVGATLVLYDGNPAYPDLMTLWRLAERTGMTLFGTSAPFIQSCLKESLQPSKELDLSNLQAVGSTGAPLPPEGFEWVMSAIGEHVQVASVSGGTDVCTGFVGSAPLLPVYAGEIQCRMLGCAVEAFNESGRPVYDEVGELVITKPMPSMPIGFWNDPDGSRLKDAYFSTYPGVWRHGDWVRITPRDTLVIYGRSDSTLNRGGVRMGTSEFYRVVEDFPEVADSLVVDTSGAARTEGELILFLVPSDGSQLDTDFEQRLRAAIRAALSPRHVPDRIVPVAEIPRTINGKKCEVPVKRILLGTPAEKAVSEGALRNPDSLVPFIEFASTRR